MFKNIVTSVAQASPSGHVVAIVFGVLYGVATQFLADQHVVDFIHLHWWAPYVVSFIVGSTTALLAYYKAQKPAA